MVRFRYTARDANANLQHGDIDAVDIHAARSSLRAMGLHPENIQEETHRSQAVSAAVYYPFTETLQLYAGWLLFGYIVAFLLGGYALLSPLPFDIPFVRAFLYSELIISFSLASFLFLFVAHVQKRFSLRNIHTVGFAIVCCIAFVLYRLNT